MTRCAQRALLTLGESKFAIDLQLHDGRGIRRTPLPLLERIPHAYQHLPIVTVIRHSNFTREVHTGTYNINLVVYAVAVHRMTVAHLRKQGSRSLVVPV